MKKAYETPEIDIYKYSEIDAVTTSDLGLGDGDGNGDIIIGGHSASNDVFM